MQQDIECPQCDTVETVEAQDADFEKHTDPDTGFKSSHETARVSVGCSGCGLTLTASISRVKAVQMDYDTKMTFGPRGGLYFEPEAFEG